MRPVSRPIGVIQKRSSESQDSVHPQQWQGHLPQVGSVVATRRAGMRHPSPSLPRQYRQRPSGYLYCHLHLAVMGCPSPNLGCPRGQVENRTSTRDEHPGGSSHRQAFCGLPVELAHAQSCTRAGRGPSRRAAPVLSHGSGPTPCRATPGEPPAPLTAQWLPAGRAGVSWGGAEGACGSLNLKSKTKRRA